MATDTYIPVIVIISCIIIQTINCATYNIEYQTPDDCLSGPADAVHQYFDISQLACQPCAQTREYQTVSSDGLRCVCQTGLRLLQDFGGSSIECDVCPTGEVASEDGWQCVQCATANCLACDATQITVERLLNGSWSTGSPSRSCQSCSLETSPNSDATLCVRCNQVLSVLPTQTDCICPTTNQAPGGLCFTQSDDIIEDNSKLFEVEFSSDRFDSAYFAENVQAAAAMCQAPYQNLTACQELANLCVLIMYTRENEDRLGSEDACAIYLRYAAPTNGRQNDDWPPNMPWLYYLEETGDEILDDKAITTEYTFNADTKLDIEAAIFTLNGSYVGYNDITNGLLQMCENSDNILNAAFDFGTFYEQTCKIKTQDLWDEKKNPLHFYDLYLPYDDGGEIKLYAVPILINNYKDDNGAYVNQGNTRSNWQLVRRFFLVDNISGKRSLTDPVATATEMQDVRYVESITIEIELQTGTKTGQILPPYLKVNYNVSTGDDYDNVGDPYRLVSFRVNYRMNMDQYNKDIGITIGVLAALAVAFSGLQTWGWTRRSGRLGCDFVVICKFLIFAMGNMANVFFAVLLGSSLWWIIFYKNQNKVSMIVPNKDQESQFVGFLASAFVLKFFQLLHILVCQVTVDIFFIDWERPRGKVISSNDAEQKGKETPVSIWRTYFAANEWNEIQTCRKLSHIFQIFMTVLVLNVIGFGKLATADPHANFRRSTNEYYSDDSRVFRFAVSGMTYLIIAILQWVFYTFIYERFIEDKVSQYVDLCSMSNISVFILETGQFGYYIHGRSVHGRADTGMREMSENMKREEDNLCGQRGLIPNTDKQTFSIAVPTKLRNQYDKVLRPIYADQGGGASKGKPGSGPEAGHLDIHTENCLKAYNILNRFLQAFIDHSLREIDYVIKDRTLLENVLDMEFVDPLEESFFYSDSGHSFSSVLLFGHENTLIIFEILLFGIIDLVSGSYILAAVIVYIFMQIIQALRDGLGRSNLAKKTLVDKRFLI